MDEPRREPNATFFLPGGVGGDGICGSAARSHRVGSALVRWGHIPPSRRRSGPPFSREDGGVALAGRFLVSATNDARRDAPFGARSAETLISMPSAVA